MHGTPSNQVAGNKKHPAGSAASGGHDEQVLWGLSVLCALAVAAVPAIADNGQWVQMIGCRDARSGAQFSIHGARFASDGSALLDSLASNRLCVGAVNGVHAVPITDGAGGAYIVWIESAGEDCDLRLQHVAPDGNPSPGWPQEGRSLCAARGTQTQPAVLPAAGGGAWVAWKDYRDPRHVAVFLARFAADGATVGGGEAGETMVSDNSATDPRLCSDGSGGAWLLWLEGPPGARTLRLTHHDAGGSVDPAWGGGGRSLLANPAGIDDPAAAPDGLGGIYLAWKSHGAESDELRLLHLGPSGSVEPEWSASGIQVTAAVGGLSLHAVSADSTGASVGWTLDLGDSVQARVQSFDAHGAVRQGWPSGGRRLGLAGTESTDPVLARAEDGGNYLAWVEYQPGSNAGDIRLTRMLSNGITATSWPADGVFVTSTGVDKHNPRLLLIPEGVLASWSESEDRGQGAVVAAASAIRGALPQLLTVERWPDLVRFAWSVGGTMTYEVIPERRGGDGIWIPLKALRPRSDGRLLLEDPEVVPGERLTYRLRLRTPLLDALMPEIAVEIPPVTPLAIRGLYAGGGRVRLFYSVPARGEVRFELFDIQGRRLMRKLLNVEHAGELDMEWPLADGIRVGIYFARLQQARETRTRRFVLSR